MKSLTSCSLNILTDYLFYMLVKILSFAMTEHWLSLEASKFFLSPEIIYNNCIQKWLLLNTVRFFSILSSRVADKQFSSSSSQRKDRSLQESSVSCGHGQQAEQYLQYWCDWNMQEINRVSWCALTEELSECTLVLCFTQQFHPLQLCEIHNYWYMALFLAFSLGVWRQGRGHACVIDNSVDRLSSAHFITQVRSCAQERESSFHCHHSAVQLHLMLGAGDYTLLPKLDFLCFEGK